MYLLRPYIMYASANLYMQRALLRDDVTLALFSSLSSICAEMNPHYFVDPDGTLVIYNTDPADTATYVCSATNDVGSDTRPMTLYVRSTCLNVHTCTYISQSATQIANYFEIMSVNS